MYKFLNVIKKPLLETKKIKNKTEKFVYKFVVDNFSNKNTIKLAIETLFEVEVFQVRTLFRAAKAKAYRRAYTYFRKGEKMAYVTTNNIIDFSKYFIQQQEQENNENQRP